MFPKSPKVALARVIHWVLLLGQQGGSWGYPITPVETSGPATLVGKAKPDQPEKVGQLDRRCGEGAPGQGRGSRRGVLARQPATITECQALYSRLTNTVLFGPHSTRGGEKPGGVREMSRVLWQESVWIHTQV